MPEMIKLTLPYPPSSNRYWRTRVVTPKGKKPFVSTYISQEAIDYKEEVSMRFWVWKKRHEESAVNTPFKGDVGYKMQIFRPQKSGDTSNRQKVLEDALQGFAYIDDKQISKFEVERFEDKDWPRVEIEIYERPTMPLLDTIE